MYYEIFEDIVTFYIENPKSEEPFTSNISIQAVRLKRDALERVFDALCKQCYGKSVKSQKGFVTAFGRSFVAYLIESQERYPKTSFDWQRLIFNYFRFYLLNDNYSKATASTRIQEWSGRVKATLEFFLDEEIIPADVLIPTSEYRDEKAESRERPLVGNKTKKISNKELMINKLLINPNFGFSDSDFLENIESECNKLILFIKSKCLEHWKAVVNDHEIGFELASQISIQEIERKIESKEYTKRVKNKPKYKRSFNLLTSTRVQDGHIWALALTRYYLNKGKDRSCISVSRLHESPFFNNDVFDNYKDYFDVFSRATKLKSHAFNILTSGKRFYQFAGILSGTDIAAICCLLIIEHPQFTPESLQNAKLLNVRGKSYVLSSDNSNNILFSIDKPRAGKHKSAVLSPLAQEIITYVIKITTPIRNVMRSNNDKGWRFLFLGQQNGGFLGPIKGDLITHLKNKNGPSLFNLYPEFSENNLDKTNLDFRRIRNTMGVLCWFETGSIIEMSKKLGNSYRVALEHYIPPGILHKWNTRIIRRFQNTIIIIAVKDEEYLLDVTDFNSFEELFSFIAQIVYENKKNSGPIGEQLQKKYGEKFQTDKNIAGHKKEENILNIRLSSTSISYLYAFSDFATRNYDQGTLNRILPDIALSPMNFIELSKMIKHICESNNISECLRGTVDIERLRKCHFAAIQNKEMVESKFDSFSLSNNCEMYGG